MQRYAIAPDLAQRLPGRSHQLLAVEPDRSCFDAAARAGVRHGGNTQSSP